MTPHESGTILAISGSLKRSSINSSVLRAAAAAAAWDGISVTIDHSVRELPHFDPDLETQPPEEVLQFRAACQSAVGVLLAVPEYVFGIPGSFKNALDWTVGAGSLYRKPVSVLSVAHPGRGEHVRRALELVMKALDADVVHHSVPVVAGDRDEHGEIANARIIDELLAVVVELANRAGRAAAAKPFSPAPI